MNTEKWNKIVRDAQEIALRYGIPASVMLAQLAHESNWGQSAPGNNFFGIKGTGTAGTQKLRTREDYGEGPVQVYANFAAYKTIKDGLEAYARLITQNPIYKNAMQHTDDPERFLAEIKKAGYATDPQYVPNILPLVRQFAPYDRVASGAESGITVMFPTKEKKKKEELKLDFSPVWEGGSAIMKNILSSIFSPAYATESVKTKPVQKDIFGQLEPYRNLLGLEQRKQEMTGPLNTRLFEAATNKPKIYSVQPGDTLWEISRRLLGDPFRWKELGFAGDQRKLPIGYQIPIPQSSSRGGGGGGGAPSVSAPSAPSAPSASYMPQVVPKYTAPTPQVIMRAIQNPPQYTRPTQRIPLNFSLGPTAGSSAQRRRNGGASASW